MKIDMDKPFNVFLAIVCIFTCVFFMRAQFKICVAMPGEWFMGFSAECVFVGCVMLLFNQRE